jgi:hypothetical protein
MCCLVLKGYSQTSTSGGIVAENKLPGTTDWLINVKYDTCQLPDHRFCRRPQIEGYCSQTSVEAGDTIDFFVSTTPARTFSMNIYRMGYYQGRGGNLKKNIKSLQGNQQAEPRPDPKTNFFECNWDKSYSLVIPENWLSGVYVCKLTTIPDNFQSYMIFIVRDNRRADFLFQCADLTWQSYNRWPQWHSMYDEAHKPWVNTNGAKVSFDRPYALYINELPSGFNPLSNGSGEFLLWEYPMCYWLEKEGYDVSYITNVDVHANKQTLDRGKAFLSVGHDEYWTYAMYNNVAAARDKGLNLIFLSGNTMDGIQYLEPSTDGRPNRSTGRMPEREYQNEQDLMGSTSWGVGYGSFICTAPDNWVYANTGMKKGDSIANIIGWEYNGRPLSDKHKVEVLAESSPDPLGFGQSEGNHVAALYYGEKGNFIFNAGTCWWPMLLAKTPAYQHPHKMKQEVDFSKPDKRVQQITRNLLNRAKSKNE